MKWHLQIIVEIIINEVLIWKNCIKKITECRQKMDVVVENSNRIGWMQICSMIHITFKAVHNLHSVKEHEQFEHNNLGIAEIK